ncbi:MAG: endonuclease/exonuclease/phosphatase family metal-dependent hydrolase [Gammaproteobacteria bacterium]
MSPTNCSGRDSLGADHLRIATYNTKNLFNAKHPHHPKKPREVRELARMVAKLNAHVLGLQEVENETALAELNQRLPEPYAHCGLLQGNSHRGINLAFMSRFPIHLTSHRQVVLRNESGCELHDFVNAQAVQSDNATALRFQRDLLLAQFTFAGHTLALFNAHLKSPIRNEWSNSGADVIRAAEARAIQAIVSAYAIENPDHLTVLLGDLNQRHDHESLQAIMSLGYFDPVLDELVPENNQLSTHWSRPRARIDHLLLGPAAHNRYIAGSAAVHREAGARKASDHYPVSIALQF